MASVDAVVIGGGPAGLAAAIALRRAGLSAMVADVYEPPVDKICGEGILPDGLAALTELGVSLPTDAGRPLHGISFIESSCSFRARLASAPGLGLRRTVLHALLAQAAREAGVVLRWKTRAEVHPDRVTPDGVMAGGVTVGDEAIACRYVVGADGQRSAVRRSARLSPTFPEMRTRARLAFRRHYQLEPWSSMVEVHWAGRTQAYITPVGEREVSVALVSTERERRFDDLLGLFPALTVRLRGAEVLGRERGGTSLTFRLARVMRGRVLLIGESSGCVDAITGDGLTLLFRQALALGQALGRDRPHEYEAMHGKIMRRARLMSRLLLLLSQHPQWRARVFRALSAEPLAFENLLHAHTGARPRVFGAGGCLSLGTRLLLASALPVEQLF